MSLANLEKKRDQLVIALENLKEEIAKAKKKAALEKVIEDSKQQLLELEQDTPQRRAQLARERRVKELQDLERRRKEEAERPSYWPLPRGDMSKEEQNEWFDSHGY